MVLSTSKPRDPGAEAVDRFIAHWDGTERAERANYALLLAELCALIGVDPPAGAIGGGGDYRFERTVTHHEPDGTHSARHIDLYRRGCFVLEAKLAR